MRLVRWRVALVAIFGATVGAAAAQPGARPRVYELIAGGERSYTIAPGDTVWSVTGRFTMSRALFDAFNALPDPDHLRPGTPVWISDRHIVPQRRPDGIVIDLANRTLYWSVHGALAARFPVGVGRLGWATPPGRYRIVGRRVDPVWHVPASVQQEMRARGEKVETEVAAGPENPLGKYWIQLSAAGYGLHGTNAPSSVGKYATHGCLRLLAEDVERLFHEARDGTPVEVVYEPLKLARNPSGTVYLEIHRDVYHGAKPDLPAALAALDAAGLRALVDPDRVAEVVTRAWGTPEEVTRSPLAPVVSPTGAELVP
jgi:L,D-transpeptidase ErfK/SrfK